MSIEKIVPQKPISSLDVPWEEWSEGTRFGERYRHLSRAALGKDYRVGVAIEEFAPGRQSTPAHYHIFEEKHVLGMRGVGHEELPGRRADELTGRGHTAGR